MLQMSRFLKVGALALTVAFVASTVAEAQEREGGQRRQGQGGQRSGRGGGPGGGFFGGGRGPGGGLDKLTLVSSPQVREELKIGEEQMFFIEELLADHREKSRAVFSGIDFSSFREKSEEERRKMMEDLQAKRSKIVKENEGVLAEFLSKEQNKRIGEIVLQAMGIRALTDEDVAKKLELSGDQKKKIEDALKAGDDERRKMFEEMRGAFGGGRPGGGRPEGGRPEGGRPQGGADFTEIREKMEALGKKTNDTALAVLSSEQKQKFESMKGKAFELDRRAMFSRGGQGGGRGQGGRGGEGGGRGGQGGGRGGDGGRRGGDGGQGGDGAERPRRPAAE